MNEDNLTPSQIEEVATGKIKMSGTAFVPDVLLALEKYKIKGVLPTELFTYLRNIEKSDIYVKGLYDYQIEAAIEDEYFDETYFNTQMNPYELINHILQHHE